MKINVGKPIEKCRLGNFLFGDVVAIKGRVYLITEDNDEAGNWCCVDIKEGRVEFYSPETEVAQIEAEVNIISGQAFLYKE